MWQKAQRELRTISKGYATEHMMRSKGSLNSLPADLRKKVDQVLSRFVAVIPKNLSIEQKVALLYYTLTSRIQYDHEGMDRTTLPYTYIGALCKRRAVCMGIAELFCHLCTLVRVNAVTVIGYACSSAQPTFKEDDGGLHAWVMVQLSDGTWVHLDPTWDLHTGSNNQWRPKWFLLSDHEMVRHFWLCDQYPKATTKFQGKINLNLKGVEILCKHYDNLTAEFAP